MSRFNPELIIRDYEFDTAASECKRFSEALESTLQKYDEIIGEVLRYGVSSGLVHDSLEVYREYVIGLKDMAQGIGSRMSSLTKDYVKELESADDYLYDAGKGTEIRDYSEKEYIKLREFLSGKGWYYFYGKETWWDAFTKFFSWIVSTIFNGKSLIQKCQRTLMDQNNETLKGLEDVFDGVYSLDDAYGRPTTGYFAEVISAMDGVYRQLMEMDALLKTALSGQMTPELIHSRLSPMYEKLLLLNGAVGGIRTSSSVPTPEDIGRFAESAAAAGYFSGCTRQAIEFGNSITILDGAGMTIFQMADLFDIYVKKGNFIDSDGHLVGSADAINTYKTKEALMEMLDSSADTEYLYDKTFKESLGSLMILGKYYKKFGDKFEEYIKFNTAEDGSIMLDDTIFSADQLKMFNKCVSLFGTISKDFEKGVDFVSRLIADYSAGIAILDSYERNFSSDDEIGKALAEIRKLYEKDTDAWVTECLRKYMEDGYNVVDKKISKSFEVFFLEGSATKAALDAFGEASGWGARAKGAYDFTIYQGLYNSSLAAYQSALEKLRAADPSSEQYETLTTDVNNCFNLCKNSAVKMFESMETASVDKKDYYRYCRRQVEKASVFDKNPLAILSYEDYMAA